MYGWLRMVKKTKNWCFGRFWISVVFIDHNIAWIAVWKFDCSDFPFEIKLFTFKFPPIDRSSQVPRAHRPDFQQHWEKPGFFLQTHDFSEKPGFFPPITGTTEVYIQTREICRVQKLRVCVYINTRLTHALCFDFVLVRMCLCTSMYLVYIFPNKQRFLWGTTWPSSRAWPRTRKEQPGCKAI